MRLKLCVFLLLPVLALGQDFPKNYFKAPLKIPLYLAGNFGEIRSGHFHAGIDIKTQLTEGHAVIAAADGYVSRIKISSYGYGKVLYITHPNGYTTVYGHLQQFVGDIGSFVKKSQYYREKFAIELFPAENQLPVQQGDTIALSGNSGSSGGPHLHFEIREKGSIPTNPLLYGFDIKDNIPPIYKKLSIYPMDKNAFVNENFEPVHYDLNGSNGKYNIIGSPEIKVHGNIGFGIEAIDNVNGSNNRCGVYAMQLQVGGKTIYEHEINRIGFYETRFINSHVDYYVWKKHKQRTQRNFIQPNNQLSIYNNLVNNGVYNFNIDSFIPINQTITDAYGNSSQLKFKVKSSSAISTITERPATKCDREFKYDEYNSYENDSVVISIPKKLLYEDLCFEYKTSSRIWGALSATHHIHNIYTPLHSHMTISIKTDSLPTELQSKALIVALNENKKIIAAEGGTYQDGFMTVKTRSLGPYAVVLDTTPPKVTPVNISNGRNMASRKTIVIKIADNLSGIKTYRGTIDDKWILMQYDHKKNSLTYDFEDKPLTAGKHTFKLIVGDKQNNETIYEAEFTK